MHYLWFMAEAVWVCNGSGKGDGCGDGDGYGDGYSG